MERLVRSTLRSQNCRMKRKLIEQQENRKRNTEVKEKSPKLKSADGVSGDTSVIQNIPGSLQSSGISAGISQISSVDLSVDQIISVSVSTDASDESVSDNFHKSVINNTQDSEEELKEEPKSCEADTGKLNIEADLKFHFAKFYVPYNQVNHLLGVLKPYHKSLPLHHTTLFGRDNEYNIEEIPPDPDDPFDDSAEFVYFGITEHLRKTVNTKLHPNRVLKLQFHFDGLTLFGSSKRELWPILGKVYTEKDYYDPWAIAIHSGRGKPKCLCQYLWKFIGELNTLQQEGIVIDGIDFKLEVMSIVADTPARAFIKRTKGHTGFCCCERCTVIGFNEDGRTIFPANEGVPRTDESFRNQDDKEHHQKDGISPLLLVRPHLNMILLFVLDFMHLVCLGVTKKLMTEYWVVLSSKILGRTELLRFELRLKNLKNQLPEEFQRSTRSLDEICKWKATEFRFFVLYAGIAVLKDVLPKAYYEHFLLFSMPCRILCSKDYHKVYIKEAKMYLETFVKTASHPSLYGLKVLVINLHNLLHLADDVENMGCSLMDYSAFCFENFLGKLKGVVEGGNKPLIQLCNKINDYMQYNKPELKPQFEVLREKKVKENEPSNYLRVRLHDCELFLNDANSVVMLNSGEITRIKSITSHVKKNPNLGDVTIKGSKIDIIGAATEYPCNSSLFNMYRVKENDDTEMVVANLSAKNVRWLY
ncbi:hypothetical protein QAD02_016576 [Eretmocerus hayati]|uniref:Uncharacterized protein n=1 Tax=Eretmocerus hayati TaxID=131215 RepID=A0ACC2PBX4_9HYME|nr:hypothetical protein QAD02_016576 [Eretmocerus hayati]